MNYDMPTILKLCAICAAALWFIGVCMLIVATRKARDEFREKGFLRTPTGTRWFRFLLMKEYDYFEDPGTRFYFAVTHVCLMGVIIVATAVAVLVGSEVLLNGVSGLPGAGRLAGHGGIFSK